jgi:hypothetical protein
MISHIRSVYICEYFLLKVNIVKIPYRNRIDDAELDNYHRVATIQISPDINALVTNKQCHFFSEVLFS